LQMHMATRRHLTGSQWRHRLKGMMDFPGRDNVEGFIRGKAMQSMEKVVKEMKEGSVIIDVAIDQGGCVETGRLTSHDDPVFVKHGVIHYCVPNIPSRVARTASLAISNVLGPLLVKIGDHGGVDNYIKINEGLKQGIFVYRHHLTKKYMSHLFGMNRLYRDIELLVASM